MKDDKFVCTATIIIKIDKDVAWRKIQKCIITPRTTDNAVIEILHLQIAQFFLLVSMPA